MGGRSIARFVEVEEITEDGNEDVYNMEVCGTHNFSVNGGVVVHNCMDAIRYFVRTMKLVKKEKKPENRQLIYL